MSIEMHDILAHQLDTDCIEFFWWFKLSPPTFVTLTIGDLHQSPGHNTNHNMTTLNKRSALVLHLLWEVIQPWQLRAWKILREVKEIRPFDSTFAQCGYLQWEDLFKDAACSQNYWCCN